MAIGGGREVWSYLSDRDWVSQPADILADGAATIEARRSTTPMSAFKD